ncbi:beta-ketoacyl-[acyl-carrier-protein] synthase II [Actinoplanes sp. NBRC 101535]|nr:beta-ketoacyl-[acyl-carrier-protein] synthase II [Actinoplanes sp. NBRC 101535]
MITGVGLLTAAGTGWEQSWASMLAGRSAIGPIKGYDASSLEIRYAAELPDFHAGDYAPRRMLKATTRNDQLAIAGAVLAVRDAGGALESCDPERAAVFVGGNKEVSNPDHFLEACLVARTADGTADHLLLGENARSAFYPLFYVEGLQSAALFHISQLFGVRGANAYFHGTADAGLTAIGRAFRSIRRGESDVAIAGGFDDAASWWTLSKMEGLGVLSTSREEDAFRPYDTERSGSVLGDGSAWLVLEEHGSATRRGARVHAEVTGFGSTFDGTGLLCPAPDGAPLEAAVRAALREARLDPSDVGYVAAHACATGLGDVSEARALAGVFGAGGQPPVSGVKPVTGHLVAGAGALNAGVAALAVGTGAIPPTANLRRQDPECPLTDLPRTARQTPVRHAVAIARGLEGQQVALVVGAP